MCGSAVV